LRSLFGLAEISLNKSPNIERCLSSREYLLLTSGEFDEAYYLPPLEEETFFKLQIKKLEVIAASELKAPSKIIMSTASEVFLNLKKPSREVASFYSFKL
jgi:hypothetical protein